MRRRLMALLAAAACAGCATVRVADDYHGMGVEGGETPVETVEIENVGWLLLNCVPLASGDPSAPNRCATRPFMNTVTLQSNLSMLGAEMKRAGASRVANLVSRKTDESVFLILLTRRAYHTSAVLLK